MLQLAARRWHTPENFYFAAATRGASLGGEGPFAAMVHEQNTRVQAAHGRAVGYADCRDTTCLAEVVEHRFRLLRQGTARFRV